MIIFVNKGQGLRHTMHIACNQLTNALSNNFTVYITIIFSHCFIFISPSTLVRQGTLV